MDKSQQIITKSKKNPKYMLLSNTLETLPFDITFDETPLESVSDITFLGITV